MLLEAAPCLENLIVQLLLEQPRGSTAREIHTQVVKRWCRYSLRGIYKELARLEDGGVLVRAAERYMLRAAWIAELSDYTERLQAAIKVPTLVESLLAQGRNPRRVYRSDLRDLDRIWTQLMLELHARFPQRACCIWAPHHWFYLAQPHLEKGFARANELAKNLRFLLVGSDSYLDLCDEELVARKSTAYTFDPRPFTELRDVYFSVIENYVVWIRIDRFTQSAIESVYTTVKSARGLNVAEIKAKLFGPKCKATLRLEVSSSKSGRLRRIFEKLFALQFSADGKIVGRVPRGRIDASDK